MEKEKKPDFIEDLQTENSENVPFETFVAEEPEAAAPTAESEEPEAESEEPEAAASANEAEEPARQKLKELMNANEDEARPNISLRTILGGDIITGRWFRKNLPFIMLLSVLSIIYISSRYAYEFEMLEQKELTDTLHDRRYKALTRSSQLLEKKLRSNVEGDLADSTIQTASTPSYIIRINREP